MAERLTSLERVVEEALHLRLRAELRDGGVLLLPFNDGHPDLAFANLIEERLGGAIDLGPILEVAEERAEVAEELVGELREQVRKLKEG